MNTSSSTEGSGRSHPKRSEIGPEGRLRVLDLRRHRVPLLTAIGAFVIKDAPVWLLPVITAAVVDTVVAGGPLRTLGWLALAGLILLAQNYPLHLLFVRLFMGSVRRIGADLRNALTARLQQLSIGFHARASASILQTKLVRDVENIEMAFLQAGQPALSAITVLVGALTMTALQVPQFLPVFLLTIPVGVALWWLVRRRSAERNARFRREVEAFSSRVGEMTSLIQVTRAHGVEDVAAQRVAAEAENVRESGLRLDLMNGRFGALSWVSLQLLTLGCLIAAAAISLLGWVEISPGQVVLLSQYFSLLTGAVTSALSLVPVATRGRESVISIAEVLREPDVEFNEGKAQVDAVGGRLRFADVGFTYPDGDEPAIDGIDLEIEPGQTVALVGASGSGKSTLLNLVLGFVRPTRGSITLDDRDLQSLDMRSVRRFVSVVPQESVLFEGTIRENVCYGLAQRADGGSPDEGHLDHALWESLRSANAAEFVEALPQGVDTITGERGARLSGGQRQRLSIARALIRDPRILLLDEATSALDSHSEKLVQQALATLMAERTTLVVAHRLSTIRAADRILVMEQGRVVEDGNHAELLAAEGRYARMHRLQYEE